MNQEFTASGNSNSENDDSDMLPEYTFDYTKAKPNRFVQQQPDERLVVVLDPDIARVFKTPEAVMRVLRALIATMPPVPPAMNHEA